MNNDEFLVRLESLPGRSQAGFLLSIGLQLTIAARGTYVVQSLDVERPWALRGINEIQHRVLGQAIHVLQDTARYPNDTFVKVVNEIAVAQGCEPELAWAIDMAASNLSQGNRAL
jgi:hypothetical protein